MILLNPMHTVRERQPPLVGIRCNVRKQQTLTDSLGQEVHDDGLYFDVMRQDYDQSDQGDYLKEEKKKKVRFL